MIETRMRGRPGECESSCTQTCTVTPMSKADTCAHGVEGPGGNFVISFLFPSEPNPKKASIMKKKIFLYPSSFFFSQNV